MIKQCEQCGSNYGTSSKKARFCSRVCLYKNLKDGDEKQCPICGKMFYVPKSHTRITFCSNSCRGKSILGKKATAETRIKISNSLSKAHAAGKFPTHNRGELAANYKNGETLSKGYKYVFTPEHPYNHNGYIREHRLIVEKRLGRTLEKTEVIHHINGDKLDNRLENLYLFKTTGEHTSYHGLKHKPNLISNI